MPANLHSSCVAVAYLMVLRRALWIRACRPVAGLPEYTPAWRIGGLKGASPRESLCPASTEAFCYSTSESQGSSHRQPCPC
jgi:hypothetical protein